MRARISIVFYLGLALFVLVLSALTAFGQIHSASIINVQHVSCYGGSNGSAAVNITSNPAAPCGSHTVAWSTGSNSSVINGLTSGIYFVNVTDNCSGLTVFAIVVINQPLQLTGSVAVTNVLCKGESTGQLNLTVSGGTPVSAPATYNYSWSPGGAVSEDLMNIPKGTYGVNITDANGCTTSNSAIVTEPLLALNSSHVSSHVSCKFGSDGAVNMTVWGGVSPYGFDWDAGTYLSEDVSGLAAGNHALVITDANNCTLSRNIVLTEPPLLTSSVTGIHVLCHGGSTGSVDLSVAGGMAPFTYSWTGSQFTLGNVQDLNNVPADAYNVTITDAKGCVTANSFIVSQPPLLTASISAINVSCFGQSDGSIDVTVGGGSPPYSFAWSNTAGPMPNAAEDLPGIPAGNYSVTVSDSNNCTVVQQIAVTQPLSPLTTSYTKKDVKCHGGNDGSIDLFATGGTAPYTYLWSTNDTIQDLMDIFAGTYSVIVEDAFGCSENEIVIIGQPAAPLAAAIVTNDVKCFGSSDGSIQASVSGGTLPYSYQWANSLYLLSAGTASLINYPADNYSLKVTDTNGCLLLDSAVINQPPKLTTFISGTDILCYGDSTGSIDLTVSGGTAPYTYNWSNSAITEDLSFLKAGKYVVNVADFNNCRALDSMMLAQPLAPLSSQYNILNTTCFGYNNGAITHHVMGGTAPYVYQWSNAEIHPNLFNLTAGLYVAIVTDDHGCVLTDSLTVGQPDIIRIDHQVREVRCAGFSDGAVDISVSGGTPTYRYHWTNSKFTLSSTGEDILNMRADTYTVLVIDTNGCREQKSVVLDEPDPLALSFEIADVRCFGANDGRVTLTASGGIAPYGYAWSNGSNQPGLTGLAPGRYFIVLTDANDCSLEDSLDIAEPEELVVIAEVEPVSCAEQSDGMIRLSVGGGTPGYVYDWSNGEDSRDLSHLPGGEYTVVVSDILDCEAVVTINVPVDPKDCIDIPTAFTPNGDGKNDTWRIHNMELYPNMSVVVFNKWGKYVYQSDAYTEPWDGTKNGQPVPAATYYYIINPNNGGPQLTGPITIVR